MWQPKVKIWAQLPAPKTGKHLAKSHPGSEGWGCILLYFFLLVLNFLLLLSSTVLCLSTCCEERCSLHIHVKDPKILHVKGTQSNQGKSAYKSSCPSAIFYPGFYSMKLLADECFYSLSG